jgi:nicotinamidase-related amidase
MPAIQALEDGYTVYVVTDASGGTTREAHDMAVQRMIQAGMVPITSGVVLAEFQRDWAREATVAGLAASWDSTAAAARSRSPGKCSCSTPPPLLPQAREWQPAAQEPGRCTQHRPASITACCRT